MSLVELLVVLTILGLVMVFVVPGFNAARATTATNTLRGALVSVLLQARSVAASREQVVVVCPSEDQRRCMDTEEWHHGFVAAVDVNGNGTIDASEPVVASHGRFDADTRAVTSSGRKRLKFHPNGGNAGSNATFTFCDRRGERKATAIAMGNEGRYRPVTANASQIARACAGFR